MCPEGGLDKRSQLHGQNLQPGDAKPTSLLPFLFGILEDKILFVQCLPLLSSAALLIWVRSRIRWASGRRVRGQLRGQNERVHELVPGTWFSQPLGNHQVIAHLFRAFWTTKGIQLDCTSESIFLVFPGRIPAKRLSFPVRGLSIFDFIILRAP